MKYMAVMQERTKASRKREGKQKRKVPKIIHVRESAREEKGTRGRGEGGSGYDFGATEWSGVE